MPALLWILALLGVIFSLLALVSAVRTMRAIPNLAAVDIPSERARWPRLSVVVTARDEAASIEEALRAKLADDYPDIEFIVVDDRSTDGTGEIIDRLAREDSRVHAIHLTELPPGWLGKVHAMQRAFAVATGEWVLFSDADVHLARGALKRSIAHCESRGLDHLAAFPEVWSSGPLLDAALTALLRFLVVGGRLWAVSDPRSKASVGGGNFNLVRRELLERLGGFDDVRLDVLDDILLGQRVKRAGGRQGAVNAADFVALHFYETLGEMTRALEKNSFALHGYSVVRVVVSSLVLIAIELGPWLAMAAGSGVVVAIGAAAAALGFVTSLSLSVWLKRPVLAALLSPLGTLLLVGIWARGSLLALWRGEIVWRDTRYSLDELRRGVRFEMPI
jgi:cellulose synthase/poly-beta-1,6-N-acetylglucosamine synthase-like glycosyltransferase